MKILNSLKIVLLLAALAVSAAVSAASVELADNHPVDYTVVEGDTLWDISGKFLKDPWRWPEIWRQNSQIQNPDLIYPGDRLVLRYTDGQPYLDHLSGRERAARKVVKMGPAVYIEKLDNAIPAIPPQVIMAFLEDRQIVESRNLDKLAYVTEGVNQEVVLGALSDMYVRKIDGAPGARFRIIRMRGALINPDNLRIMVKHLLCAAFELPFGEEEEVSLMTSCCCSLSSTRESHAPQLVHFPIHLGVVIPQC